MTLMKSWIDSANSADTDFPLNNLPCGVFSFGDEDARCGVAIGDLILDVSGLEAEGLLTLADHPLFDVPFWNELMDAGPSIWAAFRAEVTALLADGSSKRWLVEDHLVKRGEVMLHLPIGYNGRASSVVVSGTDVCRPWGQTKPAGAQVPVFAPSQRFDFEVELGAVVGQDSTGMVSVSEADAMIFGYVLLNDWSARDIQAWEAQPLGPFQAKATATTISPWIVMAAALQPFRVAGPEREMPLLPYLAEPGPMLYDIALDLGLTPDGGVETVICQTNYAEMYYSAAQQLCHHTTSGCPMNVGDLLGSGTISGPSRESRGSMLELSWGGTEPVAIAGGTRTFLEDGDRVTLRGAAVGDGFRIGFGDCKARLTPAVAAPDWVKGS